LVTYDDAIDDDDRDAVFKALADPTRRRVLDLLFTADGRTLADLCAEFPELTRFGVMKHLAVLESASLVVTHRVGRSKHHYLNPVPIAEIHDRWTSKYASISTDALLGLRRALEP
jgi:DNA-binding transcriptional ArsR family regulator